MHFIFGGRAMGKLAYAKGLVKEPVVCDLQREPFDSIAGANIVRNTHAFIRQMVLDGKDPIAGFEGNLPVLRGKIVIGDEVGCGVVPVDLSDRQWRDQTGRVYQLLAANADDVTRVWAGIPQALKRNGARP